MRDKPHRPTIKEVAKEAGVSFRTVARVVSNETAVSDDKRQRVEEAMAKLGYRPNVAARQLRSNRSFLIALLTMEPAGKYAANHATFLMSAQMGAMRRCRETGYNLLVEQISEREMQKSVNRLQTLDVDGVVVLPPVSLNADFVSMLVAKHIRPVLISSALTDCPVIGADERLAGYEMTKHLIGLGHRKIAFIGGRGRYASKLRHAGYLDALKEAGIDRCKSYEVSGDFTFLSGRQNGEKLLKRADRPSAIFAATDAIALGAIVAAARLGLSVPADISIAGYDDSIAATVVWPQLTTVFQPIAEMTAKAIDILTSPDDYRKTTRIDLPTRIVRRGTTAKYVPR